MRSALVPVLVFLTLPGLAGQADPIDAIVRREMAAQRIPGVAVAVIRGGSVVKASGARRRRSWR